mmetsp:Transcript_27220/g.57011  ORF Transcript_27220/g.57011 Transcript_27220/m.57011 type:complete len:151 (+) Transcript_27220:88-540(+)
MSCREVSQPGQGIRVLDDAPLSQYVLFQVIFIFVFAAPGLSVGLLAVYDTIRYGTILLGVCGTLVVVLTQFCLLFCTRSFPPTLVHRPTRHIHTYIHTYTMHRNRQPNDAQQHEPEAAVVAEADPREPETTFCNSTRTIRPVYRSDPPPS